ncbi:unnamed protein product [Ceratitis capitata]|uniref:(Mediterranean fruit fly) hypothetical protein n=1 Tax=Ceratitis capitata TaxID=7213 RepID=A0A811VAY8_CERCA|nr:unnamed protein product [Ceratitis capitata]
MNHNQTKNNNNNNEKYYKKIRKYRDLSPELFLQNMRGTIPQQAKKLLKVVKPIVLPSLSCLSRAALEARGYSLSYLGRPLNTTRKVLDEKAEGTCLKLNLCVDNKLFNSMSKNSFMLNFRFGSILAKPWRSGGQEEKEEPDSPEAKAIEKGAVSKCSSSQDKSQMPNIVANEIRRLKEFISRDLVAMQIRTKEVKGSGVNIVAASANFPGDSNIITTPESELLLDYRK